MAFDGLELRRPERAVQLEPFRRLAQRAGLESEHVRSPRHRPAHDACILEHLQVLRDGRLRDAESSGRLSDGRRAVDQPLDDRAPNWMREGKKAAIELRVTVHLLVNYTGTELGLLLLLTVSWPANLAERLLIAGHVVVDGADELEHDRQGNLHSGHDPARHPDRRIGIALVLHMRRLRR